MLDDRQRGLPRVGLRAAASPEAPRCPVCDSPLFGWVVVSGGGQDRDSGVVRRCEECGIGVTAGSPPPSPVATADGVRGTVIQGLETVGDLRWTLAEHAAGLSPGDVLRIRFRNRASLQASLGGAAWSGLDPSVDRFVLTPEAVRRMLADSGLEPGRTHALLRPSLLGMWQTALNTLTFERDFGRRALGHRRPGRPGGRFWIDAVITAIAALPVALITAPLELAAAVLGRAGVVEVRARRPG